MTLTRTIAVCSVVLGLSACSALFGPNYALRLGVLEPPAAPLVTVPDTVAASTDFDVSVRTSGGGCNDIGTTEVAMVDERTAEVRPWDYAQVNAKVCTAIYKIFNHHATLRFANTGIATVRVIGQSGDSTITIARTVVVR
jgi:hypothetical protein